MAAECSNHLICRICSEPFTDPRMLPCLHSFCCQCLRDKVGTQQSIQCPSCLRSIPIPMGGVNGLPQNLHLGYEVEIAGYVSKLVSHSEVPCTFCVTGCTDPAVAFCCTCHQFMCTFGHISHKRIPLLSQHKLLPLGQQSATQLAAMIEPSDHYCSLPKHMNEKITLYCKSCSHPICKDCALDSHKEHNTTTLSNTAHAHRDEMRRTLDCAQNVLSTLAEAIEANNKMIQQIERSKQDIKSAIEEDFKQVMDSLEERKKTLLAELENMSLSNTTSLTLQKEQFEKIQQEMNHCTEVATHIVETHTDHEVVVLGDFVSTELKAAIKKAENISLIPNQRNHLQFSGARDGILKDISEFGTIIDLSPSPLVASTHCKNKKYEISVDTMSSIKERYTHGGIIAKKTCASTSEAEVFDDIELQGKISEGGQGAVYRAIHKKTGKLIAAKKMPIESIATGEKELAMMKSLKNKNIVELFGVAKDPDGGILILMELADDSLFGVFKKSAPEITRSMNWAAQVAEGMCYLHYGAPQLILHGDMKSSNVLSFPNGIVKISDFGCSKFHNITRVTKAAISILWSAPELFAENQKPNFSCDVYSYGILLWEMMTHKQPYEGMSVASILSNILSNNVRPDIPASCPAFVSDLMKECWDRDPKKRPTFKTIVNIFEQRLAKSSDSNASPSPNQVEEINDFELKERIGAGGTGIVLKAFWKSKNMMVAVKKVHVNSSESIMKEVAIIKSVRHKNIVHFYNVCQDADQNYLIVLELAVSSLDKEVKTIEPNIKRTVNWAIQVAKGMSYLHYDAPTSIIHGDLKSMNVLTFPGDVVKINDFGSAKFFDVTRQTSVNVTLAWSAPELFKKKATPNPSCDVYSFGVLLWEMLTHEEPYADCEGQQQILGAVMTGERPEIPETCPKLLSDLIVKCWDGNPQVRPNFKIVLRNLEDVEEKLY